MGISLPGIFSGIDTDVLLASMMQAERVPLNRLEVDRSLWAARDSAIDDLESRLGSLKSLVDELRSEQNLRSVVAGSGDSDVATAIAGSSATEGVHTINVNRLAQADRLVHTAGLAATETWINNHNVAAADAEYISAELITANTGEHYRFEFKFGDESTVSVDLSGYDETGITLNQLVSEINTEAGYTAATAVQDGSNWKLMLRASAAGTGKDLTVTDNDSVGMLDDIGDFTQKVDPTDGTNALVGAGQFVYTYDGQERTITAEVWTSLGELVDMINNDGANPGVTASSFLYDGAYHLVLAGIDTGDDYAITIDDTATTISGFDTADFTRTVQAQDAQIRLNGFPAADWIERSSNLITDVLPGVSITLRGTGETTINLSRETGSLKADITNLVEIYNGIATKIESYAGFNEDTEVGGVFQGDSVVLRILDSVRSLLMNRPAGFIAGTDPYTTISDIGLEFGQSDAEGEPDLNSLGRIYLDDSVLDEALSADYLGVLRLIGADGTGASDNSEVQFTSTFETTPGLYDVKVIFDASGTVTEAWMRADGESGWREASIDGSSITGQAGNAEQGLLVTANWDSGQGAHTTYANVQVRQGFAGAIYDHLVNVLDAMNGTIAVKKQQIEDNLENIDSNIEIMERRLESREIQYAERFARLETTLTILDAQNGAFEALIAQVDAMMNQSSNS